MQQHSNIRFRMVSILAAVVLVCAAAHSAPAAPKVAKIVDIYAADPITLKQTGAKVQITLAPEEYEPAPILVKSPKAVPEANVTLAGDLVAGGSKLAKSNVAIWAVDDSILRKDGTTRTTGDPTAHLTPGIQPFWLRVYAPKGTKPGTYTGKVLVIAGKPIGSIPIEVTVLPIRLLRSSKQYGMLIPFSMSSVSPETYRAYLTELHNTGFNVSALPEPPASANEAFAAYKASKLGVHGIYAGFLSNGSISSADIGAVSAARRSSGVAEMFFLGADRPSDRASLSAARDDLKIMREAGVRTAARIDSSDAYDYLKDDVNAFIYRYDLPYVKSLMSGTQTRCNGKREWCYWDGSQNAMKNRIYGGVMLWKSGLDGAYVEPGPVNYNSLRQPDASSLLAPAEDGVLPTVKWEMLREGIDDTRYITTMMSLLREAKDQKVGKSITSAAEAYVNAFLQKPFDSLSYSDVQKFRIQVAQYIVKLRAVVKP